jgi:hypothetical protein
LKLAGRLHGESGLAGPWIVNQQGVSQTLTYRVAGVGQVHRISLSFMQEGPPPATAIRIRAPGKLDIMLTI